MSLRNRRQISLLILSKLINLRRVVVLVSLLSSRNMVVRLLLQ